MQADNERTISEIWNQRLSDIGEEPMPELDIGEGEKEEDVHNEEEKAESGVMNLLERLKYLSDSAYIESLDIARTTPCLGWEAKVRAGQFGRDELNAHRKTNEAMGRHIAYATAMSVVREFGKERIWK